MCITCCIWSQRASAMATTRTTGINPRSYSAAAWPKGSHTKGERSGYRDGASRGEPSAHLPPTAFVSFIQNHDQVGNRKVGERLTAIMATPAREASSPRSTC